MRNLITICLLLLCSAFTCGGQRGQLYGAKVELWVERVGFVPGTDTSCGLQRVTMVSGENRFGLVGETDTLALVYQSKLQAYQNEINDDLYDARGLRGKDGFLIFITPIRDKAPHATHSLILSTSNICK